MIDVNTHTHTHTKKRVNERIVEEGAYVFAVADVAHSVVSGQDRSDVRYRRPPVSDAGGIDCVPRQLVVAFRFTA